MRSGRQFVPYRLVELSRNDAENGRSDAKSERFAPKRSHLSATVSQIMTPEAMAKDPNLVGSVAILWTHRTALRGTISRRT
jgi:hypothetical protein